MGSLGGGDSSATSYGYLPYVSPQDAGIIGQYQSQAASQAADYAKKYLNDAMASVTKNFTDARGTLQPYVTQGVQATDELNRYLGLNPYNPGSVTPNKPTDPAKYVPTQDEINNYVKQNSYLGQEGLDHNTYTIYTGEGVTPSTWAHQWLGGPQSSLDILGEGGATNLLSDSQKQQITGLLSRQYQAQNKDLYAAQMGQYNTDLQNYNTNKALYDKYSAAGPYTADQIQQTIANQPGFQAQMDQGTQAIQKSASARGLLGSGNMLKDLANFGSSLEGQYYNSTLDRLAQQAGQGAQAAASSSQASQGQGGALAGLQSQLADALGNSALARGQALASSYQLGHTQYNQVTTGQSNSSSSGLSGLGSALGGIASLKSAGIFSSKTYKTKGKNANLDLARLKDLPVEKWKYKKNLKIDPNQDSHIGPYAEDFKKVFGVGDGKTIPIISAVGILYGLVKELNQKIDTRVA